MQLKQTSPEFLGFWPIYQFLQNTDENWRIPNKTAELNNEKFYSMFLDLATAGFLQVWESSLSYKSGNAFALFINR